ncbi:hypothetical protein LTR09_012975 [Extremus antarcticus]|uniref:P-loop containing nucleoside triphosphate hydrolase protein n=1 Tax=Extremus antarcticus TaxID=702011 RepID=A0AAJ0D9F5_9PEZI|nr:hypothetical protein LTR09_012975 [Extremus antarcticus]
MGGRSLADSSVADLDNKDRVRVLGIIDKFRELGVNEDISLPQLVVVGDQSSGKSSLLEGLTGLSFPIASELCTRFATQIVLRRSPTDQGSVKVSILPGPTAINDESQKSHLQSFAREIEGCSLSAADFENILDEAAVHMGLPAASDLAVADLPKRFSDDVLKIELSGPEHHHLSVVDVPGLFHNPTKYQTQEDLDIIRRLLESYVVDRRTIILAVMDARNNLANQEVFRMARAADPQGKRTVGIITKCDALQSGDEQMVLNIAQNSVERLTHGWFAVKNRSTQEIQNGVTIQQRHRNEKKFFDTAPWNALPKTRVGISSLKTFLGKLLYEHIQGEFPALVQEIRTLVHDSRVDLDALGPPRQTTLQQRQFLSRMATKYQRIAADSLKGNYDSEWDAKDSPHLKNDESIYTWIRQRYRESRGSELPGTVNPTVLENLFRQQAAGWRTIATNHLNTIDRIVSKFNERVWQDLVLEEDVRRDFETRNVRSAREAWTEASKQLELLLADETKGILQTVNHYFADTLAATRQDRVLHRLKGLGFQDGGTYKVDLAQITAVAHLSNEEQAVYDIHDILRAYYKVAIKRFTDNVVLQVVERCYLDESGPIKYVSPGYIGELADEELSRIAAESYATSTTRNEISHRLERLERALEIAEAESM